MLESGDELTLWRGKPLAELTREEMIEALKHMGREYRRLMSSESIRMRAYDKVRAMSQPGLKGDGMNDLEEDQEYVSSIGGLNPVELFAVAILFILAFAGIYALLRGAP